MKYTQDYFEEVQMRLFIEAERLANNLEVDGLTNHILTIRVEDDYYNFTVDATMFNLYEMRDINAVSYRASIVCTEIPEVINKRFRDFLKSEIHCETLYRD